jgi:hypothetical protein
MTKHINYTKSIPLQLQRKHRDRMMKEFLNNLKVDKLAIDTSIKIDHYTKVIDDN